MITDKDDPTFWTLELNDTIIDGDQYQTALGFWITRVFATNPVGRLHTDTIDRNSAPHRRRKPTTPDLEETPITVKDILLAKDVLEENKQLREALGSIANNSCCDGCQEAKKVALQALTERTR